MDKIRPELPDGVRHFARFFSILKYISERYLGYLFLGALVWGQWHQAKIKSSALITLYYAEATEESLTSMETNQRGYLYIGDPDLYVEYVKSKAQYMIASRHLDQAITDDPEESRRFADIESTVNAKITEMDQTISFYRSGKQEAARQLVLSRQGQRYMEEIRRVLSEIRATRELKAISAMNSIVGVDE